MAETKETLSIKAQFDSSQLKGEAKRALSDLGSETKRLQRDFQSTDRAATQSLKSVERQADKTANAVKQIGKEAQNSAAQLQRIGMRQAAGIAGHGLQMVAGAISQSSFGQTDNGSALAGGLSGAAAGLQFGAMTGNPVIAGLATAAGALLGAGNVLLDAAKKQRENLLTEREKYDQNAERVAAARADEAWKGHVQSYVDNYGDLDAQYNLGRELKEYEEKVRQNKEAEDEVKKKTDERIADIARMNVSAKKQIELQSKELAKANSEYERLGKERATLESRLSDLRAADSAVKSKIGADANEVNSRLNADRTKTREERKSELKEEIGTVTSRYKTLQDEMSFYSKMSSTFRLSDALTKVGGTSGYGDLNESVQSSLNSIVKSLNSLVKKTTDILANLNGEYSRLSPGVWAQ